MYEELKKWLDDEIMISEMYLEKCIAENDRHREEIILKVLKTVKEKIEELEKERRMYESKI